MLQVARAARRIGIDIHIHTHTHKHTDAYKHTHIHMLQVARALRRMGPSARWCHARRRADQVRRSSLASALAYCTLPSFYFTLPNPAICYYPSFLTCPSLRLTWAAPALLISSLCQLCPFLEVGEAERTEIIQCSPPALAVEAMIDTRRLWRLMSNHVAAERSQYLRTAVREELPSRAVNISPIEVTTR